jgi:hypothetical protein
MVMYVCMYMCVSTEYAVLCWSRKVLSCGSAMADASGNLRGLLLLLSCPCFQFVIRDKHRRVDTLILPPPPSTSHLDTLTATRTEYQPLRAPVPVSIPTSPTLAGE